MPLSVQFYLMIYLAHSIMHTDPYLRNFLTFGGIHVTFLRLGLQIKISGAIFSFFWGGGKW